MAGDAALSAALSAESTARAAGDATTLASAEAYTNSQVPLGACPPGQALVATAPGTITCAPVAAGGNGTLPQGCALNQVVVSDGNGGWKCADSCNGTFTDFQTDPNNCGGCGKVCSLANATATCVAGACKVAACSAKTADCDGNSANGCETNTTSDAANCGGCGIVCGANAPYCQNSVCVNVPSCHGPFAVKNQFSLDAAVFSGVHNNFHPQSLAYDPTTGFLVYAPQGPTELRFTNQSGVLQATTQLTQVGNNSMYYTTGIAIDSTYLFISDYTCNNGCTDLVRYTRSGNFGITNGINPTFEVQAYGGYPLEIGGGNLFRGNFSNDYTWTSINQIRVSPITSADNIIRTINTNVPRGIGDLAWDGSALWAMSYSEYETGNPIRTVDLYRIDPNTGATLESYTSVYTDPSPLRPAGVAYGNNSLWIFDYSETAGVPGKLTQLACH
jgi:hypothetical protein